MGRRGFGFREVGRVSGLEVMGCRNCRGLREVGEIDLGGFD